MGLFKLFGIEKESKDEKNNSLSDLRNIVGAINPDKDPRNSCSAFVDASSISPDEKAYYREDEYYTYYSYPETLMARRVVSFEERKKLSIPTQNNLYVAEILLLEYCTYGDYPKPKSGYPGFWWFAYGIRDVGHVLESLYERGFIQWAPKKEFVKTLTVEQLKRLLSDEGLPTSGKKADLVNRAIQSIPEERFNLPGYTPKYELTELGRKELTQNGYVPYMHKHKYKTTEDDQFGSTFNVWSINSLFPNGDASNWRQVVGQIEEERFGVNMAGPRPKVKVKVKRNNDLNRDMIRNHIHSMRPVIDDAVLAKGDGYEAEVKGLQYKKEGRDDEALVQFYIAIGKKFDAPALYRETEVLLRKYKMYEEELSVLDAELEYSILKGNRKAEIIARKEKLNQLIQSQK